MRAVLITGAAGGIGAALCSAFHDAGWHVLGVDVRSPKAPCDTFLKIDLERFAADANYREAALVRIRAKLPSEELAALVNNAATQTIARTEEIKAEDWDRVLRVNLTAPFFLTQGLLQALRSGRGCVINIGSIHGHLTKPGFVSYATSKSALEGLTRALAVDIGEGVRVCSIAPAAIRTPMLEAGFEGHPSALADLALHHPVKAIGEPFEVAAAALFLASAPGSFLNGTNLRIDGGIAARLHDPV